VLVRLLGAHRPADGERDVIDAEVLRQESPLRAHVVEDRHRREVSAALLDGAVMAG
jgi:hypothetical protein